MEIKASQTLLDLEQVFAQYGSPLYIVGGFVRNSLLGFCETDLDICGPVHFKEVQKLLDGSNFSAEVVNPKLGTLLIKSKTNSDQFEYTTFRKESYTKGGAHSPDRVVFVKDIREDASRRDFTCNAIYHEVGTGRAVDFYHGIEDTLARVLRTVETPEYVFSSDGLRILRMVRMSSELDFSIAPDCFQVAKNMISQLADISQERFNKEIVSIIFADYKYAAIRNPHAPARGLKLLSELGAWCYVFGEISVILGASQMTAKLRKSWLKKFETAPAIHRVSVFTLEFLQAIGLDIMAQHIDMVLGTAGLMLSKKEVLLQTRLLTGLTKMSTLQNEEQKRCFIQANSDVFSRMIDLAAIFGIEGDLGMLYSLMVVDGVPMNLKQLAIGGRELEQRFPSLQKRRYGEILEKLLKACCLTPELNTAEHLLERAAKEIAD